MEIRRTRKDHRRNPNLRDGGGEGLGGLGCSRNHPELRNFHRKDAKFATTDKDSGITNDANLWDTETVNNLKYPLELFLGTVAVSLETNRVLSGLEID